SEAAARTFSLVTADPAEREEPRPDSTKEAVARETPAARATSTRVTVPRRAGTGAAVPGSSCVRDIVVSPSRSAARRRGSAYRCESTGRGAQNRWSGHRPAGEPGQGGPCGVQRDERSDDADGSRERAGHVLHRPVVHAVQRGIGPVPQTIPHPTQHLCGMTYNCVLT